MWARPWIPSKRNWTNTKFNRNRTYTAFSRCLFAHVYRSRADLPVTQQLLSMSNNNNNNKREKKNIHANSGSCIRESEPRWKMNFKNIFTHLIQYAVIPFGRPIVSQLQCRYFLTHYSIWAPMMCRRHSSMNRFAALRSWEMQIFLIENP